MNFSKLGLNPRIIKALEDNKYLNPTPIQEQAIPEIMNGRDIIACAQTGTGKTAAFSLPLIEGISRSNERWRQTTVLILSPTRELATQIVDNVNHYSKYLPIRCCAVYGGVSKESQLRPLSKGVQIVVATPGRLLDFMRQRVIDLSHINTLVLDEADRMLDMGFIRDVQKIIRMLPNTKRQNLLFSATFSREIKNLSKELLNNPKIIQIAKEKKSEKIIEELVHPVRRHLRKKLLTHILKHEKMEQVLIFTKTKRGANDLAKKLDSEGNRARAFHSDKSQGVRKEVLDSFKNKKLRILVATDIAARGIDIQNLPYVINFDLPQIPENYVHRIGRTGRAGQKGQAITFLCPEDEKMLNSIENFIGRKLSQKEYPGYELGQSNSNKHRYKRQRS